MKHFVVATLLFASGACMAEPARSTPAPAPQTVEEAARLQQIEQQKARAEAMNLPPAQRADERPQMLDLPVNHDDSPGATKK